MNHELIPVEDVQIKIKNNVLFGSMGGELRILKGRNVGKSVPIQQGRQVGRSVLWEHLMDKMEDSPLEEKDIYPKEPYESTRVLKKRKKQRVPGRV